MAGEDARVQALLAAEAAAEAAVAPPADPAALAAAVALIPTDPAAAAAALDAIAGFEPAAWGTWLALATRPGDPSAEADAALRWERARAAGLRRGPWLEVPASVTRAEALLFARFARDSHPDPIDVPCAIAERWPEDWLDAFGPWYGSSRDLDAPACDPDLDGAWASDAVAAAFDAQLGPLGDGFCGSVRYSHRASARTLLFRAWHSPRALLDPERLAEYAEYEDDRRQRLASAVGPDAVDPLRAVAASAPAEWSAALGARARARGLSGDEAAALVRVVAREIVDEAIYAELACSRPRDLRLPQ